MLSNTALKTEKTRPLAPSRQWSALLELTFAHSSHGTQLTTTKRHGPLSVQKAFYPEGKNCAHVYLLHPPAGIVSGDSLTVTIDAQPSSHVLITTPGGNRFYRARTDETIGDPKQRQTNKINIAKQATVEHFPLETIVYKGADAINLVDIHLTSESVYMGWDISCLGLPASSEPFTEGSFTQLNRLFIDDKLCLHDRINLNPDNGLLTHSAGLAGNDVFGTFLVCAPNRLDQKQRVEVVNYLRQEIEILNAQHLISITDINGVLVIRYLGSQAEQCKNLFFDMWQIVRPLVADKDGIAPRIWHT